MSTYNNKESTRYNKESKNNSLNYNDFLNLKKRIHSPKVDLIETETFFMVKIELPGVDKETIKINIKDDQFVFISGSKTEEQILVNHRIVYTETKYKDFTRRVKLPSTVHPFNNVLNFNNGVLTLHFYKITPTPIQEQQNTIQQNTIQENTIKTENGNCWSDEPV